MPTSRTLALLVTLATPMQPPAELTALDHALAALLLLVLPLYARRNFARLRAGLAAGDRDELRRTYRRTVIRQTLLGLGVIVLWLGQGRSLAMLGLGRPAGWGFVAGGLIAALLLTYAILQVRAVRRSERLRDKVRERFAATELAALVPRDQAEMKRFVALALSAGIWEELLFRGFLIAWFAHWLGAPMAVLAAAIAFGLGHLYQGAAGVAKTTVAGLIAGGLYLLTGSLWIPMILHTAVDLHAGALGYLAGVAATGPTAARSEG